MKELHISDVLSVTTPRLVSYRHIDGVYALLGFLSGEEGSLYTHQLPRVNREVEPWIRTQFPQLMADSPQMAPLLKEFCEEIDVAPADANIRRTICSDWVEKVRAHFGLPDYLPVYEMPSELHTHIDPIEEAKAMVGDRRVIAL